MDRRAVRSVRLACGDGTDRIADADLAVGEDVCAEPTAVDECAQNRAARVALHNRARFAQAHAAAVNIADRHGTACLSAGARKTRPIVSDEHS